MKQTLYARYEPTKDTVAIQQMTPAQLKTKRDVCLYTDATCTQFKARFAWYQSYKPTRRNRVVTVNCYTYNLKWV